MRASSVERLILETLSREQTHLTSLQIYEQIRERLPAVNPSTVYRALERLVKRGKVSVSDIGIGSTVYEILTNGLHHHFVCQQCGLIQTIHHEDIERFFATVENKYHFKVITNHLILFGICEHCIGGT